jgi:hypothetical protein
MDKKLKTAQIRDASTIKRISPTGTEGLLFGAEKIWDSKSNLGNNRNVELIRCFNFYNSQCSEKDARSYVETYIKTLNKKPKEIDMINHVNDQELYGPLAWLCRMNAAGYVMSSKELQYIEDRFKKLIISGKEKITTRRDVQKVAPIDIQKRTTEAIHKTVAEFDNKIDEFVLSKCKIPFDSYAFLKSNSVKPLYAKRIAEIYMKELKEIKEVIRGKDEQLNEGYCNFKPREIKKLHDFYQKIIDDSKLWADHLKKIKAPRKKKVKSADQLIQRLKYMKGDADLKLTSIEPTKLIGSSEAWIFNVKTRRVDHYFSNDADGISIKGSTLQNINETTSIAKKIRKPLEVSKNIVMGTSRGATKYFDAIKTKPIKSTGRLNAFSIILRVV